MKKQIILAAALAAAALTMTGCVKVIDKGTEGQYTGEVAFDAAADSSGDWEQISGEITDNAKDIADVLSGDGIGDVAAVSGTAEVTEFISKGPKNILAVTVDGYDGKETFLVQIGSVYSGTAIRDAQTVKGFEQFTNQTEWSAYAKALNAEMHAQVMEPLGLDDSVVGKKITFIGAATKSGDEVTVTPVALTVE